MTGKIDYVTHFAILLCAIYFAFTRDVKSTARPTIQNCKTSPVHFRRYSLHHKAHTI
jgi:hypothetical protein